VPAHLARMHVRMSKRKGGRHKRNAGRYTEEKGEKEREKETVRLNARVRVCVCVCVCVCV